MIFVQIFSFLHLFSQSTGTQGSDTFWQGSLQVIDCVKREHRLRIAMSTRQHIANDKCHVVWESTTILGFWNPCSAQWAELIIDCENPYSHMIKSRNMYVLSICTFSKGDLTLKKMKTNRTYLSRIHFQFHSESACKMNPPTERSSQTQNKRSRRI